MQSAPTEPTHPKKRLVTAIHDPEQVERMMERARTLCDGDPVSDAVFVSLLLQEAGFVVPVTHDPEELILRMMVGGWKVRRGPDAAVTAGDVYVVSGADSKPVELGFIGKVALDGSWCYALAYPAAPPYRPRRRALTGDAAAPLSYHLHFG